LSTVFDYFSLRSNIVVPSDIISPLEAISLPSAYTYVPALGLNTVAPDELTDPSNTKGLPSISIVLEVFPTMLPDADFDTSCIAGIGDIT